MRHVLIPVFGIAIVTAFAADLDSTPEQQVLARYVGSWTIQFDDDDAFSTGVTRVSWTLNNAYVEHSANFNARFVPEDLQVKQLTTFDPIEKQFERWSFASNRRSFVSTGTWDSTSNTMTWTSSQTDTRRQQVITTTTTEQFLPDGTIHSIALSKHGDDVSRTEATYRPMEQRRKP